MLLLCHAGLDADEADCGNACIERYMTGSYDLVISDIDTPGLDGVEVAKQLRKVNPDLEIYAVTGSSGTYLLDDAKKAFSKVFRKPIEMTRLVSEAVEYCSSVAAAR